jgi:hypothetical protein
MSENGRRDDAKGVTIQKITSILSRAEVHRAANRLSCAVKRRLFLVGVSPTRQSSLQPVAIGAAVEATKLPEPSVERAV